MSGVQKPSVIQIRISAITFGNIKHHARRTVINLAPETIWGLHRYLTFKPLDKVTDKDIQNMSKLEPAGLQTRLILKREL